MELPTFKDTGKKVWLSKNKYLVCFLFRYWYYHFLCEGIFFFYSQRGKLYIMKWSAAIYHWRLSAMMNLLSCLAIYLHRLFPPNPIQNSIKH